MSTSESSSESGEGRIITEYVAQHPYPSYKEMAATLVEETNSWWLSAEYSQSNHICCKTIYENPRDAELCADMGKQVYARGGMTALRAMHRIVASYSPYKDSLNPVMQTQGRVLEYYFENSCDEWVA
jgi:hypothetical protein